MQIAIVGTGNVGSTLGRRFAARGHEVTYASRQPSSARKILEGHPGSARVDEIASALRGAELVLLAVPGQAAPQVASELAVQGKILIDATNPFLPDLSGLAPAGRDSGGESVARAARGARVVKAFNTIGVAVMEKPEYPGGRAALPVCGDDSEAKRVVVRLGESLGFEAFDAGPLRNARWTEAFAMLWVQLAYPLGRGPDFAFGFLKR